MSMAGYETIIGLEVHCELKTETKLFCGCRNAFGDEPNTNVCPVCVGLPGSLPVLNQKAVEFAIRIGLALNCEVEEIELRMGWALMAMKPLADSSAKRHRAVVDVFMLTCKILFEIRSTIAS